MNEELIYSYVRDIFSCASHLYNHGIQVGQQSGDVRTLDAVDLLEAIGDDLTEIFKLLDRPDLSIEIAVPPPAGK